MRVFLLLHKTGIINSRNSWIDAHRNELPLEIRTTSTFTTMAEHQIAIVAELPQPADRVGVKNPDYAVDYLASNTWCRCFHLLTRWRLVCQQEITVENACRHCGARATRDGSTRPKKDGDRWAGDLCSLR